MKHGIRRLAAAALAALLLGLAACGAGEAGGKPPTDEREPAQADSANKNGGEKGAGTTAPETAAPGKENFGKDGEVLPEDSSQPLPAEIQGSLERLQSYLECQPKISLAAAYLGEPTWHDLASLTEYFKENFSWLVEGAPFLLEIPEDRILGEGEELYCIVPRDDATTVAVNRVSWRYPDPSGPGDFPEAQVEEVLYRSENAQPLLVFVGYGFMDNNYRHRPDIEISAVAGNGAEVEWYPEHYPDTFVINSPFDEDYDPLILDFFGFTAAGADDWGESAGDDWLAPTQQGLGYTNWYCEDGGYMTPGLWPQRSRVRRLGDRERGGHSRVRAEVTNYHKILK